MTNRVKAEMTFNSLIDLQYNFSFLFFSLWFETQNNMAYLKEKILFATIITL